MPDDKDLLDAEFIDSHHQAADDRIKFAGEVVADRADDFGIAALDAHGRLENLRATNALLGARISSKRSIFLPPCITMNGSPCHYSKNSLATARQ